ncbi:CaiB/BaiF CoA transferase family protein [Paraburkholderia sp. BCC1886]|uniref:CaiB/BaiF CoA transferase family protein n=1 Tax=Paraburkholderia sp. BCC1886 TaxID=2562670 RepID=UPI00118440CF|nr:CoA transferase [Paraburkholderia sp. BCC1886]
MTLPLQGIKVLDLTRALAGPFCSMILGDLGADVIKVEPAPTGDMIRTWGPFEGGISAYYLSCNRNKRGIAVDFRTEEGLALLRSMAGKVDVVVENFKTGTMESMGLGYDALSSVNPRLVYGNITGFGRTGPAANWPGFDQVAQGYSGLMSLTGLPEGGPTRVGVAIGDMTAGMWTAMGVLAALFSRERSGRGQRVESSLLAGLVALLGVQGQRYLSAGVIPEPTGNHHPVIAPYGVFEAKDGPLNLAPGTPDMWVKLCTLLELEPLMSDPRFVTNKERMDHRMELKAIIDNKLGERTRHEWTVEMIRLGIPAGPINNLEDMFADPQVIHCKLVEEVAHQTIGQLKQVASAIGMGEMPEGSVRMPPPMLGEHTASVLREFGFSAEQIDRWLSTNVVTQFDAVVA